MKGRLLVLIGSALVFGVTTSAHHSFPATYQVNKIITIEGSLAQLLYRNPHSFIQVEAKDAAGAPLRWSLEWGGATQLTSQGVARDTLKVGDQLVITANPARSTEGSTRALLKTVRRPADGWNWGNAPGQVVD
jgi:hypothetical protein